MRTMVSLGVVGVVLFFSGCGGGGDGGGAEQGVILLRYKTGSESTEQREKGFLDTLRKEYPDIPVLADNQYAGTTREESLTNAQNVLTKYKTRATGLFAVCEPNAVGVLKALQDS